MPAESSAHEPDTQYQPATKTTSVSNADASHADSVSEPITIVGGPPNLFRQCNEQELTDLVEATGPDAYFVTGSDVTVNSAQQLRFELPTDDPILHPGVPGAGSPAHVSINGIDIVVCPSTNELSNIALYEQSGELNPDTETVILSNLLSLELHKDQLETVLVGRDEYLDALQPDQLDGSYTHISGAIEAGYCHNWDGLLVRGAGLGDGLDAHGNQFLSLTITSDGNIHDETVDPSKLGLQAIDSVGPKTAERLENAGLDTVAEISSAGRETLQEIRGIGSSKAETIHNSATALAENRVIPTSDTPVPGSDPVFIDIETDGLNPTTVWLIGVKDGIDGNYMSFITTDPDKPGKAVQGFMMWFAANAYDRTVMAWNGWRFDFPVLREHIQQHCPQHLDKWKHASKRDLLRWSRDFDNAILPGRTNKLEHVAEPLGWSGYGTGLSGAEVARQYRRWMNNPSSENELDWDAHKQYCKGDVEALEHIYKALRDANRLASTDTEPSMDVEEETMQGSLFESY